MNSQLNLLKKQSGYSQAYADGLLSLLRGKCLRTLFELGQHMLDKIQIWSQNQKLLPRLYPSSDLYNDTETAPVDSILGKNNLYLHILLFQVHFHRLCSSFFHGQAQVGTLLLYVVLLADLFYLNDHQQQLRSPVYQSILLWNSLHPDVPLFPSAKAVSRRVFPVQCFFFYSILIYMSLFSSFNIFIRL